MANIRPGAISMAGRRVGDAAPSSSLAAPPPRRRRARKAMWLGIAFLAMILIAVASMVHFTGERAVERRAPPSVAPPVATSGLRLPVAGVKLSQVSDTWGEARDGGKRAHHGTDIIAPRGTPVLAAAPGTIEKLFLSHAGGITLYVRSPDRHWSYYYAHLAGYAPGVREGQAVRTGEPIGYVGDTGNAGPGNYHLHFGLSRMAPGDGWWSGQPVDPYPYLAASAPRR